MSSGGAKEEINRFKKFVDGIESLVQSSPSKEEAKRLLVLIESFPRSTRDPRDAGRLNSLRAAIERMAQ